MRLSLSDTEVVADLSRPHIATEFPAMRFIRHAVAAILVFGVTALGGSASAQPVSLQATLNRLTGQGRLVAAQAVVGRNDRILMEHVVGTTQPGGNRPVDESTLFCIGSCSKPFASAIVMSMVEDRLIQPDRPIDGYLPEFAGAMLAGGQPTNRAPTMTELLSHRGGVYSQKDKISPRQLRWIRDFRLTLEQSVHGIAREPLINRPGEVYAYSGAGYCIAGRVAEVAGGTSIEQLLQDRIASPLGLQRTTFFPNQDQKNIAVGGINGVPNPSTPHLTKPKLNFALVGGSLYSTARETGRFLRMVASRGQLDDSRVMNEATWRSWTSKPYPNGNYGLGWLITVDPARRQHVTLSHNGSLASSRSSIRVDLGSGVFAAVHYTVARNDGSAEQQVRNAIQSEMRRWSTQR